ncbi:MAG: MaoC family dehydratase, partial [Beijerinckiaceae bacterium]
MKTNRGHFFEHFRIGDVIRHATPRSVTEGDVAIYQAIYGPRFAVQSADTFATRIDYPVAPIDDLIVFHIVFGKTVPDISLNAVANLGYAEGKFLKAVYPGDTLFAESEVIGLKENSNGKTGVVYVRTTGTNQNGETVLSYCRWVMVNKQDSSAKVENQAVPDLASVVDPASLGSAVPMFDPQRYDCELAGSLHRWGDYQKGERIDHSDAMTVEEAEHML